LQRRGSQAEGSTDPTDAQRPSKSELKRRSDELQALGEALIELPQHELDALPLPEKLRDSVELARRITKRGGLYRQRQYIGKLMRQIDVEPIRAALAAKRQSQRRAAAQFKRLEAWRDRLLSADGGALDEFVATHPEADARKLARLAHEARREHSANLPPRAARTLFAELRRIVGAPDDASG
jgi:ribosome-associated protein